ncbi:MAG: periplasmic heavy metal sensor [Pseudomonadota bacterium]
MRWGRVLRVGFVVAACLSFLLNAAVLGMGVGLMRSGVIPFDARGGGLLTLPAEQRRALMLAVREARPEIRALRRALQERRSDMFEALRADPPDPVAVEAAMQEVRAATSRLQAAVQVAVVERLRRQEAAR